MFLFVLGNSHLSNLPIKEAISEPLKASPEVAFVNDNSSSVSVSNSFDVQNVGRIRQTGGRCNASTWPLISLVSWIVSVGLLVPLVVVSIKYSSYEC